MGFPLTEDTTPYEPTCKPRDWVERAPGAYTLSESVDP